MNDDLFLPPPEPPSPSGRLFGVVRELAGFAAAVYVAVYVARRGWRDSR